MPSGQDPPAIGRPPWSPVGVPARRKIAAASGAIQGLLDRGTAPGDPELVDLIGINAELACVDIVGADGPGPAGPADHTLGYPQLRPLPHPQPPDVQLVDLSPALLELLSRSSPIGSPLAELLSHINFADPIRLSRTDLESNTLNE